MEFWGDDRGQSVQVGAILLFAILIIAMATYQAQVVPSSNAAVEFDHAQQVEGEFIDLRSSVLTAARTGNPQSTALTLGTRYPQRTFFVNPPPATGTVSTSSDRTLRIENATVSGGGNVEAFWNAHDLNFSTQSIRYTPRYNEYDNPPELVYEHSLVAAEFDRSVLARTGQTAVENDALSLTLIDGNLTESGVGTRGIDTEVLSQNGRSVSVEENGGPIVLVLPTTVDSAEKREKLAQEWAREIETDANVTALDDESAIRIELTETDVSLRLSQIGVGSDTTPADESNGYITVVGDGPVAPGETFTVEVRDRFNNPVSDAQVTPDSGLSQVRTDEDGRATFSLDGSQFSGNSETVELSINDGGEVWETVNVTVSRSAGPGGGGGGGSTTPGDEAGGVGTSGESDHYYTQNKTLSASGGVWGNITAADSINLVNPRFTPIAPDDGTHDSDDRYFRLSFVLNNSTTQYIFIVGDNKEGLNFRQQANSRTWNRKGVTLYKYEEGSTPDRLFQDERLTDAALDNWLDGGELQLLERFSYETPNDVQASLDEVRQFLQNADGSDPVEAFITDTHGRTDMQIFNGSGSGNEAFFLRTDTGGANTAPTALEDTGGGQADGVYAGLKFGIVNQQPSNQIDEIRSVNISLADGSASRIENNRNGNGAYKNEFYFDGNNDAGVIDEGFPTGTAKQLEIPYGDIDSDSGVVVYVNEFRDSSGNPVDIRGKTVRVTIEYVVDGQVYEQTLEFDVSQQETN